MEELLEPKPRWIDAYVIALRDSEGEEYYLTYISVVSLQEGILE